MRNQFVIPDDGRVPERAIHARQMDQRGDFGAAAIFVFSPNFHEVVTLYGSRFDNRKVPSGGIEEKDFPRPTSPVRLAALHASTRELREEAGINESELLVVAETGVEDTIRGDMKRYYFVALAKKKMEIAPFRSQEDGKDHFVDRQRWESVENILRGASHDGEKYNTLYSIALVRTLQEMYEGGFRQDSDFRELIIGLVCSGFKLDEQLTLLEERKAREEETRRRQWRN